MSSAASLPTLARPQWTVIWRRPWPWIALGSLLLFTQTSLWLEQRRRRFSREVGRLPQEYKAIRSPRRYRVDPNNALTTLAVSLRRGQREVAGAPERRQGEGRRIASEETHMRGKLTVAAVMPDGRIGLVEEDIPEVADGCVLLEVKSSLVSPGTELSGWRGLARGDSRAGSGGRPRPFGYSNAGVVLEVGQGVIGLRPGDRVAAIGGGYARHATHALVPQNLCVALPDGVTFDQGAYAMLSATAVQALRRGDPGFGELCCVVGLGLVGQLTARMYQLAGSYVIGWDMIAKRIEIATAWGIDAVVHSGREDEVEATLAFTGGSGLDSAVLAFGGDGTEAVAKLTRCMKLSPDGHQMGQITVVGGASIDLPATLWNVDIRRASRTGPGYHDEAWERGEGYPPVFMRWTTQTNLELCMRLIAEGKLNVDCLTTHRIPLERAEEEVAAIIDDPDEILGLVFQMNR